MRFAQHCVAAASQLLTPRDRFDRVGVGEVIVGTGGGGGGLLFRRKR